MTGKRAIVALGDQEAAEFFPGPMWAELEGLLPGYRRVRLPLVDPDEWTRLWREASAEILVSAWQTPPLNGPITANDLRSLRYVCYLAGTVRRLVPRELVVNGLIVTNWGNAIAGTVAECALMLICRHCAKSCCASKRSPGLLRPHTKSMPANQQIRHWRWWKIEHPHRPVLDSPHLKNACQQSSVV